MDDKKRGGGRPSLGRVIKGVRGLPGFHQWITANREALEAWFTSGQPLPMPAKPKKP